MIIEIDGQKYQCDAVTSKTQAGNPLMRITSLYAPVAENGFILYSEDESMSFDRSKYKYLYREDGIVKEYSTVEETPVPVIDYATGDIPESPFTSLSRRITAVDNRVTDITPFEATKTAYFGEIEKVFYGVPEGNITVFFDNYTGEYEVDRISDRVTVTFPTRLTDMTTVTLMVQK